jgi:hypothetical protein
MCAFSCSFDEHLYSFSLSCSGLCLVTFYFSCWNHIPLSLLVWVTESSPREPCHLWWRWGIGVPEPELSPAHSGIPAGRPGPLLFLFWSTLCILIPLIVSPPRAACVCPWINFWAFFQLASVGSGGEGCGVYTHRVMTYLSTSKRNFPVKLPWCELVVPPSG